MVGPHVVEVAFHVAEVADVAWGAIGRHRDHVAAEKAVEKEFVGAEEALEKERLENQKLRAAIKQYEDALQMELERQGSKQSLSESLMLSKETAPDLYDELKKKVESPAFLEKLKNLPPHDSRHAYLPKSIEDCVFDSEDPNHWQWISDHDMFAMETKEEKDGLDSEGYVMVNQDDFVDAMANFLAKYISAIPQAKTMAPKELQQTLLKAFATAEKKGKLRRLWETGKLLYTATSWGATVFGLYRHPLVMRAASMALCTTCSIVLQFLR
ncbi:hypothetical protein R1sor_020755 [Riccia sorocarpa]|uniref:ATP synthase subunit d, mitochondrial n=1 Tax=Riccia sorocarpa TaxID=122646 RepID=A0ABD3GJA9_9MARC